MKKVLLIIISLVAALSLVACGSSENVVENDGGNTVLKVAATLDPHAKILEFAKPILAEEYGIDLEITVLDDYYIFNKSLDEGEIDANYFQHLPFFENEVKTNGYDIVNVGGIHIEPFGFYSKIINDVSELKDNSEIIISNSVADHGRLLSILQNAGLIKLSDDVNAITATLTDIVDNPLNLKFTEIKPELLSVTFENGEGDLVAINGNYAIQVGLNPTEDVVILEDASEDNPYVNIVACRTEDKDEKAIQALVKVLKSDEVKAYISEEYSDGSVIPAK